MGFLRTVIIIIITYYILSFLSKYILPLFLKSMVRNAEKKFREQQQSQQENANGKVGETVITKKPENQKDSNKNVGDYIDYEEIKD